MVDSPELKRKGNMTKSPFESLIKLPLPNIRLATLCELYPSAFSQLPIWRSFCSKGAIPLNDVDKQRHHRALRQLHACLRKTEHVVRGSLNCRDEIGETRPRP